MSAPASRASAAAAAAQQHVAQPRGVGPLPDRGPAVFAVTTATLALATFFVAARLVSRVAIVRRTAGCDYVIVLAWLIAAFLSMSIDVGVKHGLGRHDRDIDPESKAGLRLCEFVFSILYNPALMATKTSILIFYLRLSKNTHRVLRLASWVVLGVVNVSGTILTFLNIFRCAPTGAAWDVDVPPARCIPLLTEFICSAPVNIVTDLAVLALPIPVLTGVRLPQRQKTILVATFALGIFVAVVDVVRIFYLQRAIQHVPTSPPSDPSAQYDQVADFSWNASLALMWSTVEVNVGIVCACVPTLKPLVKRVLPCMLVDPSTTASSTTRTTTTAHHRNPASSKLRSLLPLLSPATPAPAPAPALVRGNSSSSSSSDASSSSTAVTVTFASLAPAARRKSLPSLTAREALRAAALPTLLFFLWGFSYGLLHTLNGAAGAVAGLSEAETIGLTAAYFGGGYLLGAGVGGWLLTRDWGPRSGGQTGETVVGEARVGGFKAAFISGLLIYGIGTITFWPAAVLAAYGGFMFSSMVVGLGLAVLETAANPYLALCGPPAYAEARLLAAQAIQAVGSLLSGLLADRVFFPRVGGGSTAAGTAAGASPSLIDVQWTYLAVTLLTVLLALVFYYAPLPEVRDSELAALAAALPVNPRRRSLAGLSLRAWALALAVFAQWCYVAAQETASLLFEPLLTSLTPPSATPLPPRTYLMLLTHSAFALSRLLAAILCALSAAQHTRLRRLLPAPRTLLAMSLALAALSLLIAIAVPTTIPAASPNPASTPTATAAASGGGPPLLLLPAVLFFFAEGPVWPLIFALGLRGQGARTRRAAACITAGGCGAGVWPFVAYGIVTRSSGSSNSSSRVRMAMGLVVALIAAAGVYPGFLAGFLAGRGLVDRRGGGNAEVIREGGDAGGDQAKKGDVEGGEVKRAVDGVTDGEGDDKVGRAGEGGLLGQRLGPGWPRSRDSWFMNGGFWRDSGDTVVGCEREQAPWENQELDTRILED
ncbi:uncharacterized protein THITE_2074633 [Thermothielavioides terrestris NRRL 8126]|uniref:Rhodopsin domain-containing protein n=1 Tax=Thermothielavioides terrestris (strain ATCC 38088 / NRRL 8126) TaxID=578455 RepID=G2QT29_THETT|nr:uncharacterized protein THITE_2074633 [Thermothielavioides terrestris NRRL 8126]AEO63554.1 hypothetical protein THITE_2074633 [Thermothielavioides terrestris NRRL 8126]